MALRAVVEAVFGLGLCVLLVVIGFIQLQGID